MSSSSGSESSFHPSTGTSKQATARDVYLKELSTNPHFKLAPSSGEVVVILGARPSLGADPEVPSS
jgi:hypothetical protein